MTSSATPSSSTSLPPPPPDASSPSKHAGVLEFFHTLENLKTQKRTGWVNQKVKNPESIADHMYRMGMMALVMPEDSGLDLSKCVMMSIVHDLAEADVGDITPEHVSGVTKEHKHQLEEAAMERMKKLLGHPSIPSLRLSALYEEYEARETPESKFVKDLDLIELCFQAVEYEESNGTRTLQRFFETTVPRILHPTVKEWAHELMKERRAAWTRRGWEGYVHVDVTDLPAIEELKINGDVPEEEKSSFRLPVHEYGSHEEESVAEA